MANDLLAWEEENGWHERKEPRTKAEDDPRKPGDVDYSRIIHSASFRRLQGKTQVLGHGEGDFYRTRLTHSLEVSQISSGIVRYLRHQPNQCQGHFYLPSTPTIHAIAMTHDLGHPPFGHGGEVSLNYCMRNHGGFEGNGQTLRILTKLERFSSSDGSNLCRRTLLGTIKYPITYSEAVENTEYKPQLSNKTTSIKIIDREKSYPPKCFMDSEAGVFNWITSNLTEQDKKLFRSKELDKSGIFKSKYKSLDCSIMDCADDISFGVHDLEDGITMGLITKDKMRSVVDEQKITCALKEIYTQNKQNIPNKIVEDWIENLFLDSNSRKKEIGKLVHHMITSCELYELNEFESPLLNYNVKIKDTARLAIDELKRINKELVIFHPTVQQMEFRGQKMVVDVFEAILSNPEKYLPHDARILYKTTNDKERIICDHISGMTDRHLEQWYNRLFNPGFGSIYDKI